MLRKKILTPSRKSMNQSKIIHDESVKKTQSCITRTTRGVFLSQIGKRLNFFYLQFYIFT